MPFEPTKVTVAVTVHGTIENVWTSWTDPARIMEWNAASDDWHCPRAENDLRVGGTFSARMEAKDGSMGFDFGGTYQEVIHHSRITYLMNGEDRRAVEILFVQEGDEVRVTEIFDAESENPIELQRTGWLAILKRFKEFVERNRDE